MVSSTLSPVETLRMEFMGRNEDSGAGKIKPSRLTTSDNAETLLLVKPRLRCPFGQGDRL